MGVRNRLTPRYTTSHFLQSHSGQQGRARSLCRRGYFGEFVRAWVFFSGARGGGEKFPRGARLHRQRLHFRLGFAAENTVGTLVGF